MKLREKASNPREPVARGPMVPLREEEFAFSEVLYQTAKLVNFVWLLAEIHRRPAARRLLDQMAQALASHVRRQAGHD